MKNHKNKPAAGFSIVELLVVLVIIAVLSAITFMSLGTEKLYDADKQATQIADLLQEARQRSLSQRKAQRVEINATKKMVRLIDEKDAGNAADDVLVKQIPYFSDKSVFVATSPSNMSDSPTELSPVPAITFATSTHPLSVGDSVATVRFMKNGTATNAGTNAAGAGAVPTGATIYVWSKYADDNSATPTLGQIFRAVTVLGTTGSSRLWKCSVNTSGCTQWVK